MHVRKTLATILFSLFFAGLTISSQPVIAQTPTADGSSDASQSEKKDDDTNLDTHLYLLVGTNQDVDNTKLPVALDQVMKQLRASLPFKNYRLAATLINRVKNDGRLSLKWIGGPLIVSTTASTLNPSFNEFKVNTVKLVTDAGGRQVVRMEGFGFGARIPIQTSTTLASNAPGAPIINYEPTGLNTDISMREGEAVVVGTLNVGPSGDAIILVVSAKRTMK
ncbi:MAG: hypothetical protein ABR556_12635 [Pyrinomonadaceae bacterium]